MQFIRIANLAAPVTAYRRPSNRGISAKMANINALHTVLQLLGWQESDIAWLVRGQERLEKQIDSMEMKIDAVGKGLRDLQVAAKIMTGVIALAASAIAIWQW